MISIKNNREFIVSKEREKEFLLARKKNIEKQKKMKKYDFSKIKGWKDM